MDQVNTSLAKYIVVYIGMSLCLSFLGLLVMWQRLCKVEKWKESLVL